MAQSIMSLLGMYQYDSSIFDYLVLPEALESSRQDLLDNLLLESAELEILYPDFNILKYSIGVWSKKQLHVWQEMYDTTQYDYNPIWNKDGTYSELETRDFNGSKNDLETRNINRTLSNTETRNLTDENAEEGESESTTQNDVFGYNSETAVHESKTTDNSTYSRSGSGTQTGTVTDNGSSLETGAVTHDESSSDKGTISREHKEQGNIGVTSTQSLILEQRNVVQLNIIDYIIKDFINRFCILVY